MLCKLCTYLLNTVNIILYNPFLYPFAVHRNSLIFSEIVSNLKPLLVYFLNKIPNITRNTFDYLLLLVLFITTISLFFPRRLSAFCTYTDFRNFIKYVYSIVFFFAFTYSTMLNLFTLYSVYISN